MGAGFTRSVMALFIAKANLATCPLDDVPEIEGEIWPRSAKRDIRSGLLRAIRDGEGSIIGYERTKKAMRMAKPAAAPRTVAELDRSEAAITVQEMDLYAGRGFKGGKSRTKGLTEWQREARRLKMRSLSAEEIAAGKRQPIAPPLEDHVERVEKKVETFHTQRYANNPLQLEKIRGQFRLMDTAANALVAIQ
jgi:hypothetical protein